MEALECIYTRHSIRKFEDRPVEEEKIRELLRAAMSGPCCVNAREWEFAVVTDKDMLCKMADANGRPAQLLKGAPCCIVVCANMDKAFKPAPEYWITDCAIAGQNVCLAAHAMGLGAVWLGTYPQMQRVEKQAVLLGLPDNIIVHSLIAIGYPETPDISERDLYDASLVHTEKW